MTTDAPNKAPERLKLSVKPRTVQDKVFFGIANTAAYSSIVIVSLILIFLFLRAWPAFASQNVFDFIAGAGWDSSAQPPIFKIGPMLWGSMLVAGIGVIFAIPMAISIAYFIEFMAPKPIAKFVTILVDFLAAIPSIIIGLWGFLVLSPVAATWAQMLNKSLGFLPFFQNPDSNFQRSPFIAGIVVAVMIVPIIASITREIFSQMDQELIKGALALGATKESTFRRVILPTASGGIVGGALLGLGRALGETVAIFYVLNVIFDDFNWFNILQPKGGSIATLILAKFGEATAEEIPALMAAGVVLFVVTLIISSIASYIVGKAQPWRKN
jgi:phosphate transport system permease protein